MNGAVDLLDDACQESRGGPSSGVAQVEQATPADDLGCHPKERTTALHLWQERLAWQGRDPDDTARWPNVEFVAPCSGGRDMGPTSNL